MELNAHGCQNLINAIYERTTKDYVRAILTNNEHDIEELEDFLTSGAYWRDPKAGHYIVETVQKEIKVADEFCKKFINSNLKELKVDGNIVVMTILRKLVHYRYSKILKLKEKTTEKYYLMKK